MKSRFQLPRHLKIKFLLNKYQEKFNPEKELDFIGFLEFVKALYTDTKALDLGIGGFLYLVNKIKKKL